jgi:hypothetical protein
VRVYAARVRDRADSAVMRSSTREEPVSAGAAASFPALLLLAALTALAAASWLAATAHASILVATGATSPALRVDARGYAEVSWTAGGARRYLLVQPSGQIQYNGRLIDKDVSTAASGVALPSVLLLRKTPDGTYWALQSWQEPGSPRELHLSRWKGDPTQLTLATEPGAKLSGTAGFQGAPVHGLSSTPGGKRPKIYVFLDCFGCPVAKAGWGRMLGVAPAANGSFRAFVQAKRIGTKYRASLMGPNTGTVWAPDASVTIAAG